MKIKIPTLYRCDSIPEKIDNNVHKGRTWAEYYTTEGLMAKFNDKGKSKHLSNGIPWLVASHIGYSALETTENEISDEKYSSFHSPFISFSEDINISKKYIDVEKEIDVNECKITEAKYFRWILKDIIANQIFPGYYQFNYTADPINVKRFTQDKGLMGQIISKIVHNYLEKDTSKHTAILIDPKTFLKNSEISNINKKVLYQAIEFSIRDQEWLLFPNDPMEAGIGVSSRFSLNKHLDLLHWLK